MQEQQKHSATQDGIELFYRYRPAADGSADKAIVLFHHGHEHSSRMMFIADELGFDDFTYFVWDAYDRGHSPGGRGDSPSIGTPTADVNDSIRRIQNEYDIKSENICVIVQSVGTVLVSIWLRDYALKTHCTVLAPPVSKVRPYAPFARTDLKTMQKWHGNFSANGYVKTRHLTHNQKHRTSYDNGSLITRAIPMHILLSLYEAAERAIADTQAITMPVQLLIPGSSRVVYHKPQHDFYNRLGSHIEERRVLPGFYHDTLDEQNREIAFVEMRRFIHEHFN